MRAKVTRQDAKRGTQCDARTNTREIADAKGARVPIDRSMTPTHNATIMTRLAATGFPAPSSLPTLRARAWWFKFTYVCMRACVWGQCACVGVHTRISSIVHLSGVCAYRWHACICEEPGSSMYVHGHTHIQKRRNCACMHHIAYMYAYIQYINPHSLAFKGAVHPKQTQIDSELLVCRHAVHTDK